MKDFACICLYNDLAICFFIYVCVYKPSYNFFDKYMSVICAYDRQYFCILCSCAYMFVLVCAYASKLLMNYSAQ